MKSNYKTYIIIMALSLIGGTMIAQSNSHEERLPWVNGKFPPKKGNYDYLTSNGSGQTLEEARSTAIDKFLINLGNHAGATIDSKTKEELKMNLQYGNNSSSDEESRTMTNTFNVDRKEVTVSFIKVSEYYEYVNGSYNLWELYEVSKTESFKPYIPEYTDQYGINAAWRSMIIPGWGQFHKGRTGKGIFFLATEVVAVSSAVYFDMKRADNMRLSQETTNLSIVKEYRDRADNWALYRNVSIGAAAGVYVWNVLDAALAKGKIRYAWIPGNLHLNGSQSMGYTYYGLAFNF